MKFKLTPDQIPTQQYHVARPSVGSKPKVVRSSSNSSAHKDDRDTSTKSDNSKNWDHDHDASPHDHKVGFDDCVHQRTYKTALGDHPGTQDGPPVDLGSLIESTCIPLKDNLEGRHGHVHRLSQEERIQMLKDNGYTEKDMETAMQEAQRVHENRVRTSRSASPSNRRSRSASPVNRRSRGNSMFGFSGIQYQIPNQQVYVARSASPSNRSRSASPSNKSRGQSQFGFSGISKFK